MKMKCAGQQTRLKYTLSQSKSIRSDIHPYVHGAFQLYDDVDGNTLPYVSSKMATKRLEHHRSIRCPPSKSSLSKEFTVVNEGIHKDH